METNIVNPLIDRAEAFSKTSLELLRLKGIIKASNIATSVFSGILFLSIIVLVLLTFTIAAGLYLGEVFGRYYYGFAAMMLIYIMFAIAIYSFNPYIKFKVHAIVINKLLQS